jgi:hypothetical protein
VYIVFVVYDTIYLEVDEGLGVGVSFDVGWGEFKKALFCFYFFFGFLLFFSLSLWVMMKMGGFGGCHSLLMSNGDLTSRCICNVCIASLVHLHGSEKYDRRNPKRATWGFFAIGLSILFCCSLCTVFTPPTFFTHHYENNSTRFPFL